MYINVDKILKLRTDLNDINLSLKRNLDGISSEINAINGNIQSSGLTQKNEELLNKLTSLANRVESNLGGLTGFMSKQLNKYSVSNAEAKSALYSLITLINETFGKGGNLLSSQETVTLSSLAAGTLLGAGLNSSSTANMSFLGQAQGNEPVKTEVTTTPEPIKEQMSTSQAVDGLTVSKQQNSATVSTPAASPSNQQGSNVTPTVAQSSAEQPVTVKQSSSAITSTAIDTTKYASKNPDFTVSTGNTTYDLSDEDLKYFMALVATESDGTPQDALAVSSVILNRAENPQFAANGSTVMGQIKAPGQFEVGRDPRFQSFLSGNAPIPENVKHAVTDALNGARNHDYTYYGANWCTKYSNNMATDSGNRYSYTWRNSIK